MGPSGSGKSTLLRLVAGLEAPDEGTICIGDRDVGGDDPSERGVSMVFQSFALFPHMTVARNIGFGLEARKVMPDERDRRVGEIAAWLGLEELLERRPSELSGGERQRVALARGLVRKPRVLLMDEPLSNLDAPLRAGIRAEIKRIHRETGVTILYVTHDQVEALSLGQRVGVLEDGRLRQVGSPVEVYDRLADAFVAGFIGSPPMNLLRGSVVDGAFRSGQVVLPLPAAGAGADGEALAGFRPEAATVARGEGFAAVLELAEAVGHDRVWYVRAGEHRLAVRPPAGARAEEGAEVRIGVAPEDIRLFDAATGGAL